MRLTANISDKIIIHQNRAVSVSLDDAHSGVIAYGFPSREAEAHVFYANGTSKAFRDPDMYDRFLTVWKETCAAEDAVVLKFKQDRDAADAARRTAKHENAVKGERIPR